MELGPIGLRTGLQSLAWTDTAEGLCWDDYGSDTVKTYSRQLDRIISRTAFHFAFRLVQGSDA